jgi:hypothetical protein
MLYRRIFLIDVPKSPWRFLLDKSKKLSSDELMAVFKHIEGKSNYRDRKTVSEILE